MAAGNNEIFKQIHDQPAVTLQQINTVRRTFPSLESAIKQSRTRWTEHGSKSHRNSHEKFRTPIRASDTPYHCGQKSMKPPELTTAHCWWCINQGTDVHEALSETFSAQFWAHRSRKCLHDLPCDIGEVYEKLQKSQNCRFSARKNHSRKNNDLTER